MSIDELAHGVGPGGVAIEGLAFAVVFLFLAFKLRSQPDVKPWMPWVLVVLALGVGALSLIDRH